MEHQRNLPLLNLTWRRSKSLGLLLLAMSAIVFSIMGAFLKLASRTGMPSTQLIFTRAIFQGSITVLCMFFQRYDNTNEQSDMMKSHLPVSNNGRSSIAPRIIQAPFGRSPKVVSIVVLRGFIGGFGFILYYYSIIAIPLGDAVTLFSLYPIFTLFLALLVLGEQIESKKILAACASVTGAVLIAGPTFLSSSNDISYNPIGYVTATLGSFFGAAVIVLVRKAGNLGAHTLNLLFSWSVFGIGLSVMLAMNHWVSRTILKEGPWIWNFQDGSWGYVLLMCAFGSLAHFTFNFAAKMAPAGLGSIAKSSDIIWAYLWEVLVFGQHPTWTTWLGVILVLFSLAVIALVQFNEINIQDEKTHTSCKTNTEDKNKGAENCHLLSASAYTKEDYNTVSKS